MNETPHPYIAIEGVIGVGKTTLARLLHPRFGGEMLLEAFEANPFLSDFYSDRARYAFQTQIFFLLSRYRQQRSVDAYLQRGPLLADYFFEKDRLFAHLNLSGDELTMYDRLYEALSEKVRRPDLVVYLRAEVETLMARIAMRDRPYERQMDRAYIAALRRRYEALFANYTAAPLLVIETDALDFVRNPDDLNRIEQRIRAALAGIRQPPLLEVSPFPPLPPTPAPTAPAQSTASPDHRPTVTRDFLALVEAVGRIGGALAQPAPGPALRSALQAARRALDALESALPPHR